MTTRTGWPAMLLVLVHLPVAAQTTASGPDRVRPSDPAGVSDPGFLGAAAPDSTRTDVLLFEDFSNGLDRWSHQRLDRRRTRYAVVAAADPVLASTSDDAASALVLRLPGSPVHARRLGWRWQVESSLDHRAQERSKEGDDYAARVLVVFGDGELSDETRALAYVWATRERPGAVYRNPTLPGVGTIVVRSGDRHAGRWMVEDRDVAADFQAAFGGPLPAVGAIAIVVDTDDTGTRASAWFDDLKLSR